MTWEQTTIRYCGACGKEAGTYAEPTAHECGDGLLTPLQAELKALRARNAELLAALEAQGKYVLDDKKRWHVKGCVSARDDSVACLERCAQARAAIEEKK